MSSLIHCALEIRSLSTLKEVLDAMGLQYIEKVGENTITSRGYRGATSDADIVIQSSELRKINAGRYGDMGFKYNKKTETYDATMDSADRRVGDEITRRYAIQTIKNCARDNYRDFEVLEGDITNNREDILIYVS
jgi:hypothetical protein